MLRTRWSGVALAVGELTGFCWCVKEPPGGSGCCLCEGFNSVNRRGWAVRAGMGRSNSDPSAEEKMGHDSWVTCQISHHFYPPGKKQACPHNRGLTWCLCYLLLKKPLKVLLASEGQSVPAHCATYSLSHTAVSAHSEHFLLHSTWCVSPNHFHESLTC